MRSWQTTLILVGYYYQPTFSCMSFSQNEAHWHLWRKSITNQVCLSDINLEISLKEKCIQIYTSTESHKKQLSAGQ